MYTITFYSFKGGVGRTMALVNVAVQLAASGKKVLLVDFDLEAPGIPTFALTAPKEEVPGLVEYITEYRRSGVAPDASQYLYSAVSFGNRGELVVMPAGRHDRSYSQRLNTIDWRALYESEDGYLFFEDLKRQWAESVSPDYVLIDSRTGHSDVEGICTRQLPDAVCMLFFPNEQNLQGIRRVVESIRAQNKQRVAVKPAITVHYVVSNVPDLDDEDRIIGTTLDRFKRELGYEELSAQIHHYNSLSLLNQEVFSDKRPNSRLAKEYKSLAEAVVRENLADRDVARKFLRQTVRELRSVHVRPQAELLIDKVERVLKYFPTDSELVLDVAIIYEAIGRTTDALTLLSGEVTEINAHFLAIRARLNHKLGNKSEAVQDLAEMLTKKGAQAASLLEALSLASHLEPALFKGLPTSAAYSSLSTAERIFVATELDGSIHELRARVDMLEELLPAASAAQKVSLMFELALTCIGLGRFARAVELLETEFPRGVEIGVMFNLAMARWGLEREPNQALFATVLEHHAQLAQHEEGPNYEACLAIACAVLGDVATARSHLNVADRLMRARPRREFSPWTFTKVTSREFLLHLEEIGQQIAATKLTPAFMRM